MAFPSPHLGGLGGGMGAGMPMLAGPPGMMPPSPMGMQGHAGQLQLARRGTIPSLGYHAGGHEHMMLSPGLSAGHPSPVSPMQMQQLQAAAGMRGRPNHPSMMGVGVSPYGQSDFGDMQQYPQVPPTPTSPHVAGGGFLGSNPMQAQVSHQMHGMQVHPGSVAAMGAMQGAQIQGLPMPADSADAAAYVMGGITPMNLSGCVQGQGANSMSAQQSGKGDFDMEQEVTVKTRLKGRGTFSGNTSGSMQDSLNASHVIGSDGIPNRSNSYPSSLPPPFDPRLLHQQDMYGRVGGMQGSAPQGMGGYPHTSHMGMGRASTSF